MRVVQASQKIKNLTSTCDDVTSGVTEVLCDDSECSLHDGAVLIRLLV